LRRAVSLCPGFMKVTTAIRVFITMREIVSFGLKAIDDFVPIGSISIIL